MKGLILKIAVLLSIVVLLDFGLSEHLDSLYKKNEGPYANGHLNYYLNHIEADTLFIGSSRTMNHVDTRMFSNRTYNLSHAAMHIGFQAALLDVLEQKNKLPRKCLLIQIEADEIEKYTFQELRKDIYQLNYYYSKNQFVKSEINKISTFEFIKHCSKLYSYSGYSSLLITNPIQGINEKPSMTGYAPLIGQQFSSDEENNLERENKRNNFFYYLDHIHSICKRNNIQLICFTAPYLKDDQSQYERNSKLGERLNHKKITYFNYASLRNRLPKIYEDSTNWYNNIHLNESGAEIFTQILKDTLQQ